jgi:hypothetical protein
MHVSCNSYGCSNKRGNYGSNYGGGQHHNQGNYGSDYGGGQYSNRNQQNCDCHDLFNDIKRNEFVKVQLKSSESVKGFFLGVFGNTVILFDEHKDRINSTKICCEDVVSVTSFGDHDDSKLRKKSIVLKTKLKIFVEEIAKSTINQPLLGMINYK